MLTSKIAKSDRFSPQRLTPLPKLAIKYSASFKELNPSLEAADVMRGHGNPIAGPQG